MSIRSPKIADGRDSCSGKRRRRMRRSNGRKEERREQGLGWSHQLETQFVRREEEEERCNPTSDNADDGLHRAS